jgi:hypothetical protein
MDFRTYYGVNPLKLLTKYLLFVDRGPGYLGPGGLSKVQEFQGNVELLVCDLRKLLHIWLILRDAGCLARVTGSAEGPISKNKALGNYRGLCLLS